MTSTAETVDRYRSLAPSLHGTARIRYLLRRGTASEIAGYRGMARWLARRPRVPAGASAHSYDKPLRPLLITFLVLSAVELLIVDLVVRPWPAVRYPLLVLGVWGVITMIGMLCTYLTRPHAVGPAGILVRHGGDVDIDVPWQEVAAIERRQRFCAGAPQLALSGEGEEQTLHQVVQGATSIDITLARPRELRLPQGEVTISALHVSADDVDAFLAAARTHVR